MERETRRRPPARGGLNPQVVVFGGVLLVAALVIYVNVAGEGQDSAAGETAAAEFDPFASVPDEAPPPPRGSSKPSLADMGKTDMASGGDPFSSVGSFSDDPAWIAAEAKATEAEELLQAAMDAHLDGDSTTARANGKRAQELFAEALAESLPLEEALRAKHGNESRPVERMGRLRQNWNRSVMTLKKSAFL